MQAVILAGGVGTRISEETDLKPKPMIKIGGKREYRKREVMIPWTKSAKLPGWKNKISLKEGLLFTYR